MPVIARFLGIVVRMHYRDHEPPHFHARYGGYSSYSIVVRLDSWHVDGRFPPRALRLLLEWARLHVGELRDDWELAREGKPLRPIDPLE